MGCKAAVPSPGCLFQTVEGFVEFADVVRESSISKASGLRAVDSFSQGAVKKGILHIKLMDWPVSGMSQGEDCSDSGRLHNRTECFVVIDPGALSESTKYPAGFVAVEGAISMEFVTKNPLSSDNIGLVRTLNQIPCVIAVKSSTFFLHGFVPVGVSQSIPVRAGNGGEYLSVESSAGLVKSSLASG
jgi:hypothetical protein